jgi:hypothetical protein
MQGKKNNPIQPQAFADVQHLMPRHWLLQLEALQLPPPLDEPEVPEPELEPDVEPDELPELELMEQAPKLQIFCVAVQSTHATPAVPHVVSSPLVWHAPFESQHPVVHVCSQSALPSADAWPASSSMPLPLVLLPLELELPALTPPLWLAPDDALPLEGPVDPPSGPTSGSPSLTPNDVPSTAPPEAHARTVALTTSKSVPPPAQRQRSCIVPFYLCQLALQDSRRCRPGGDGRETKRLSRRVIRRRSRGRREKQRAVVRANIPPRPWSDRATSSPVRVRATPRHQGRFRPAERRSPPALGREVR